MLIVFEIDGPADVPIKQTNKFLSEADALAYLQRRRREGWQFAAPLTKQERRAPTVARSRVINRNRQIETPSTPLAVCLPRQYVGHTRHSGPQSLRRHLDV